MLREQVSAKRQRSAARAVIDNLADDATWDDLMYRLCVRQKIEAGLKAADEGQTTPAEGDLRALFDYIVRDSAAYA